MIVAASIATILATILNAVPRLVGPESPAKPLRNI
jgi:hypothetical protein